MYKKKQIFMLIMSLSCMLLVACGKKNKSDVVSHDFDAEYVFVPELFEMKLYDGLEGDSFFLKSGLLTDDGLIYAISSYEEERTMHIMHYERNAEAKPESLPINFETAEGVPLVECITCDEDDNLYLFWHDGDDDAERYHLSKYDKNNRLVYEENIGNILDDVGSASILKMQTDKEGNLYALFDRQIVIFDKGGKLCQKIDIDFKAVDNIICVDDGSVCLSYYEKYQLKFAKIDKERNTLGEPYANLPQGSKEIWNGVGEKVLVKTADALHEFDVEKSSAKELLKWTDVNIYSDSVMNVRVIPNGDIVVLCRDPFGEDPFFPERECVLLSKAEKSTVPVKEIITVGTISSPDNYLAEAVVAFNKRNNKYRAEIKSYMDTNASDTMNAFENAVKLFNAELVSGNGPDIICLSDVDWENLAAKGALEDLTPYFSDDSQIKKEDFVDAVVNAYDMGGKLYTLPRTFTIKTLVGKASLLQGVNSWTITDFVALSKQYPEAVPIHGLFPTSIDLLYNLLVSGWDSFVNEDGKCSFDSQEFIDLLEYTKQANVKYWFDADIYQDIINNKILLVQKDLRSIADYQLYGMLFNQEANFIGYPTSDGEGISYISGIEMLAISSHSKNKEGAWEFLQAFLQDGNGDFWFPSLKKAFEKEIQDAMRAEYENDEQGNRIEKVKINASHGSFNTEIYAATEDEIASFNTLLNNTTRRTVKKELIALVEEEAPSFYNGQKSAAEVADIIQSRVQLYMDEHY